MPKNAHDKTTLISKLTGGKTGKVKGYLGILLVSVGKDNFENDAIKAAIDMFNLEFSECLIIVADTLQRFNMISEKEIYPEEALEKALNKGNEWLNKYNSLFEKNFNIPYSIIRWEQLTNDVNFQIEQEKIFCLLQTDEIFNNKMHETIEEYGKRLHKHLGDEHFNRIKHSYIMYGRCYLIEECAALAVLTHKLLFQNEGYYKPSIIAYPGRATSVVKFAREYTMKTNYPEFFSKMPDFLEWIPYRFKKIELTKSKNLTNLLPMLAYQLNSYPAHFFASSNNRNEINSSKQDEINLCVEQILSFMKHINEDNDDKIKECIRSSLVTLLENNPGYSNTTISTIL